MRLVETPPRRLRISLTPLIDVVFILLLFFMLSTQFSRHQAVELAIVPDSASSSLAEQTFLRLHISSTGAISIDDRPIPASDALPEHPDIRAAIADSTPIHLDTDDDVSLQQLIAVSDRLNQAGATTLSLSALR